MDISKFVEAFTLYGADIAVLAAICAAVVQICKLTFMKDVPKKVITLLPFAAGVILYAAYAAVMKLDVMYAFYNSAEILEQGMRVGTLATSLYVIYEQFVRNDGGGNESPGAEGEADAVAQAECAP